MVSAGLPIGRCLDILGRHCDNAVLRAVVSSVAGRVLAGSTISAALTLHPRIFSRFETRLVQLGEKTGRLHHVLDNLARHREKGEETRLKLQSALVYPALVLVLCLTLLILGPPYLLEGQFRLIREAHQPIPWITRVLMFVSDLVRSPAGLLALGTTTLGVVGLARLAWSRETWRLAAWHQAMRWPGLGRTLQTLATARFARSLALSYRVGLPVTEGFVLAAQSSLNPVLEAAIPEAVEAVKNGSSLASALASVGFFPNLFVQSLRAAEEAGNVDGLMEWTARLYEVELESALDSFLSLIEPLLMLGLGILVGFVLLATLLPMVHVLESLA